jgi:quercetin dioxygenase-like cupin family protein
MIEKLYQFTLTDANIIERIVDDEYVNINHVVLEGNEALPEHFSNSNVYLVVIKGSLAGRFADQEEKEFLAGSIVHVPFNTKMNIRNKNDDPLGLIIFKAPHPRLFEK